MIRSLQSLRCLWLLAAALLVGCASFSGTAPKSDRALRERITGIWFSEALPNSITHVSGRYQYFPDGHFAADYRISQVGAEEFRRDLGTWKVADGVFSESVTKTTSADKPFTLRRRVTRLTGRQMEMQVDGGTTRAVLYRSSAALPAGPPKLALCDRAEFMRQAEKLRLRGFLPIPVKDHPGLNSWKVESRELAAGVGQNQ